LIASKNVAARLKAKPSIHKVATMPRRIATAAISR
jgi:hypothetical protein